MRKGGTVNDLEKLKNTNLKGVCKMEGNNKRVIIEAAQLLGSRYTYISKLRAVKFLKKNLLINLKGAVEAWKLAYPE